MPAGKFKVSNSSKKEDQAGEKHRERAALVWTAVEQLVRFADVAQIPLIGGAFGLLGEVITALNHANDNFAACKGVLQSLSGYAETLWEFVRAMSPEAIRASEDPASCIARDAIVAFASHLDTVHKIIQRQLRKRRFERIVLHTSIRNDIAVCQERLLQSHRRFQDAVSNVILAKVSSAPIESRPNFQIPGARSLNACDLSLVDRVVPPGDAFWADAAIGVITNDGSKRLVKVYYEKCGGTDAFIRDIKHLARNPRRNLPTIFGYSEASTPPFLVLTSAAVTPYQDHLHRLAAETSPSHAVISVWELLVDIRDAARFLVDNNDRMEWHVIAATLKDTRVDEGGRALLAPHWQDWDGGSEEQDEYDSRVLKEHIDSFMELHPYQMRDCRPLRSLWFGLQGDFGCVLNTSPSNLNDPLKFLRDCWPPCGERVMCWPQTCDRRAPAVGDIGIFETIPNHGKVFRRLTNISDDLGGIEIEVEALLGVDISSDGILRFEIVPDETEDLFSNGSWENSFDEESWPSSPLNTSLSEDSSEDIYSEPEASFDTDFEEGYEFDWATPTSDPDPIDGFGCTWVKRLANRNEQWLYLSQNAHSLANHFNVLPENLVLVTETTWYTCTESIALDVPHEKSLYLLIDTKEERKPKYRWTFDGDAACLSSDTDATEATAMTNVGCPDLVIDFEEPKYIQLDASDVARY